MLVAVLAAAVLVVVVLAAVELAVVAVLVVVPAAVVAVVLVAAGTYSVAVVMDTVGDIDVMEAHHNVTGVLEAYQVHQEHQSQQRVQLGDNLVGDYKPLQHVDVVDAAEDAAEDAAVVDAAAEDDKHGA